MYYITIFHLVRMKNSMNDTSFTFTSDAAGTGTGTGMNRSILLEQLATIRSLMHNGQENADLDLDANEVATLSTSTSTELLLTLTVLQDILLLRLHLLEAGAGRLTDTDATAAAAAKTKTKKKKKQKKKRASERKHLKQKNQNRDDKAAAASEQKKTESKIKSWSLVGLGGGIISLIMMIGFAFSSSSITTPFVTLSLIHPSDGSSEGEAPPQSLPQSVTRSLRGKYKRYNAASTISPLPAVVPPPIFSPSAVSHRRLQSKELMSSTCMDTPNWKDMFGWGCNYYEHYGPFCSFAKTFTGNMGSAEEACCICGGGSNVANPPMPSVSSTPTIPPSSMSCDFARSKCQTSLKNDSVIKDGVMTTVCEKAESCACPSEASGVETVVDSSNERTVHLYDECKCAFWLVLCEDTQIGEACDYAAEYCCGDYEVDEGGGFRYLSSPMCYCDFFNYAMEKSAYALKSKTLLSSKEVTNPCDQLQDEVIVMKSSQSFRLDFEKRSLEAIYSGTKGENWTNKAGWMNDGIDHCQWHGITCDDDDYVTSIDLRNNSLSGQFPIYSRDKFNGKSYPASHWIYTKYGLANLFNLKTLDLANNELKGTIEYRPLYNLYSLTHFNVSGNQLSGRMNALVTPSLRYVDFSNNNFSSMHRFEKYKRSFQKLRFCDVSNNDIAIDSERRSLEAIYSKTNGESWTNKAGWMNEKVNHCQWHGITCDGDGYVTGIELRNNSLSGQFPVYSRNESDADVDLQSDCIGITTKYGLANLFNLNTLALADNELKGTIDFRSLYNLPFLTHFDVSGNQLSGEADALVTPSITHADFSNNLFTSMRRFDKDKGSFLTLRSCDVSDNSFTIDAADLLKNIPPKIEEFIASNNVFKGNLPASLNNLPNLRRFNMSSNALSGSLPDFLDSVFSLQELDLSNQDEKKGFTGSIPEYKFQSLKKLNLAGNKLKGTIPSSIGVMPVLGNIDLSINTLGGSIPSELGMLEGTLKRLNLADNTFSETIPSQLGQLLGASVLLRGNPFPIPAPLSLCSLRSSGDIGVREFDLANDQKLCPIERNALSDFYYSSKGAEWTNDTNWVDEYESHCDWYGVTCDEDKNHVTMLNLTNNGLSGRLNESIGELTFIDFLDLSDNDIKGSIPAEVGLLSDLAYLRLSYNAFTGAAPMSLSNLTKLQLLQLQSNRIAESISDAIKVDDTKYGNSTFVTDCGVPSAFEKAPNCTNCTMCCNANDDCYPQEDTFAKEAGLKNYSTFAAAVFAGFIVLCCIAGVYSYLFGFGFIAEDGNGKSEEFDTYALSKIGKDSVYSYIVIDNKPLGWLIAFATLFIQVGILVFFVIASEANLQDDKIDIEFSWKCPRDSVKCDDKADLNKFGWAIFVMLMIAFLAKDFVNGSKLIYYSSKTKRNQSHWRRVRFFLGGTCLFSITLFALYVSTVYNSVIATSNTAIIVNSVVVLFVMDIDEAIFATLNAINDKWTEHTAEAETEAEEISKLKKELDDQRKKLDDQKKELERTMKEKLERQRKELERTMKEELDNQRVQIALLMKEELARAMQESRAGVTDAATVATSNTESTDREGEADQIPLPCESGVEYQEIVESKAQAATKSSKAAPQCQLLADSSNPKPKYQSDNSAIDADVGLEET